MRIIIIGSGPMGLGAAYRLDELGYQNFAVYERNDHVGGLCASFVDSEGFTWDLGGHVIFSKYDYFNTLLKKVLGEDTISHNREAWIRTQNKWIPYPFQNNLRHLPEEMLQECLNGLKDIQGRPQSKKSFYDWIAGSMGAGIARQFMLPYNAKVWAHELSEMSADWIAERVSPVDYNDTLKSLHEESDAGSWGPNSQFVFPSSGGTGEIYRRLASPLKKYIHFQSEINSIDPIDKKVTWGDGRTDTYDVLLSSIPLDILLSCIKDCDASLMNAAQDLKHSSIFVVGLGIKKPSPSSKCWIYFPEENSPFYRATFFSNYSPHHVPDIENYFSLLCECSYSKYKCEDKSKIVDKTIQGLVNTGILSESDCQAIVSKVLYDIDYAYPIPTLRRDNALGVIQNQLEKMNIYSRGRFGAWKYEIGNMDHSLMQGKEIVDRVLNKQVETIWS